MYINFVSSYVGVETLFSILTRWLHNSMSQWFVTTRDDQMLEYNVVQILSKVNYKAATTVFTINECF